MRLNSGTPEEDRKGEKVDDRLAVEDSLSLSLPSPLPQSIEQLMKTETPAQTAVTERNAAAARVLDMVNGDNSVRRLLEMGSYPFRAQN